MNRTLCASMVSFAGLVTLQSALAQYQLQPLWSLAPGDRPYLTTGNTERGMAYNPLTGHVLLVSRATATPTIAILDGLTGADLGTLTYDATLITGGTFPINLIGVADDGAIFGGNLTINQTTANFRLYRWADESASPTLVFDGAPAPGGTDGANNALRFGDTMDVRGAGSSTQILLGARGNGTASILTTSDGAAFTATLVTSDATGAAANNGPFGLGIAFGEGNTFWGKSSGGSPLRELSFDLATSSAVTIKSAGEPDVSNFIFNIGYDPATGLLAGIANDGTTSQEFSLFDVSGPTPIPLDTEAFPTANVNGNGTGAIDFGGGKVFALDSNNGIVAYEIIPEPSEFVLLSLGLGALWFARRRNG
ncbi:MAG TPA: PEP-CTERM sorting domain-containing protein [Verrucomicrobiota bacterium]|nr:PEP-CTERM sorting domain-containing protein [Verrucomicrobiota bacterium]